MAEDDQSLSKRERQKQRRAAKQEAQQAAARRQRIRKTAATVVVAIVVVAVIGFAGFLWQRSPAEESAMFAGTSEPALAAGCDAVEQPPDLGRGHFQIENAAQLADRPPSEIYDHRPATSGPHIGVWATTGVYERHVDERLLVHNLEHGYVVAWYSPELAEERREALIEWGENTVDDEPYLIVAEYPEPLPDGGQIAYVAWGHRQLCDDFNAEVADAFLERFANAEGPEPAAGPHFGDDGLTPGQQQVVFPPFEPPSDGAAGDGDSDAGSDGGGDAEGDGSGG